jgi:tetratricopeptide (TPR) repeat protein/TolB-like protein
MIGNTVGHYEIGAMLGAGGMGEVYRARDLNLGREVAIKLLPRQLAERSDRLRRVEQEARALSALNHPNIVTIFEIGWEQGVPYIVMELVAGRRLRDVLEPRRPLLTKRALQLAAQAADGLAAAHEAGIVHRDLKPENIIVTNDGRVKILDFGLAKLVSPVMETDPEAPTKGGTTPGILLGTVGYMSPEQALARTVDFRSDQFACGAILYEMATGRRAFERESRVQTLAAVIEQQPEPISNLNPSCPPPFRWIVERCLAKEAHNRFGSTRDLARALEDVLSHLSEVSSSERIVVSRRPRRALVVTLAAVTLLGAGAVLLMREPFPPGGPPPVAPKLPKARRSVAVLGFKNLSGRPEAAWLSTAFAQMLTTELAAGGALRTIPGENVGRMKLELALAEPESLASDTLARVGRNLGTEMVVLGSYLLLPSGQIRLDLRVQEVAAGETVAALAESGSEVGLVDLVTKAGSRLRQSIGVGEPPVEEATGLKAGVPANLEGQRLYAEGVAKLRMLDALAAKDALLRALSADPNAPLIHSALADAWSALGHDNKAREAARRAYELSANLSREERLSVEARHREGAGEWAKAAEIYGALYAFFPDNVDYGLRLAAAQASAGKAREALDSLAALRSLPAPSSDDARIDLAEAAVAQSFGDFKRQQFAAGRAAAKGTAQGARLLLARARLLEAYALERLGELSKATVAGHDARKIYQEAGDRGGVAAALNRIGALLWERGELVAARKTYEEALAMRRQIGYRQGTAATLSNLGLVLWRQGDLDSALRIYQQTEAIEREVGNRAALANDLDNMSVALYDKGDLPAARRRCDEALALCREIGDRSMAAAVLTTLGHVHLAAGDLPGARARYEEALPALNETGSRMYTAIALFGLGQVMAAEGDLGGARDKHQQALAIRSALGDKIGNAESHVALARLSILQGRAADAIAPLRAAAEVLRSEQATEKERSAHSILAWALWLQDMKLESAEAAARARSLAARGQNAHLRLCAAVTQARLRAVNGRGVEALRDLAATLAEATELGLFAVQLEARLALGEVELAVGQGDGGRARLHSLAQEASAKGFGLMARRAAATAGPAGR